MSVRFAGYAAVFDRPDGGGDIIRKGAFLENLKRAGEVPLLWQHKAGRVLGRIEHLSEDTEGKRVGALLQGGKLDGLSFGYRVREARSGACRELIDLDLVEVLGGEADAEVGAGACRRGSVVGQMNEQHGDRGDRREVEGAAQRPVADLVLPHLEEGPAEDHEQAEPGEQSEACGPEAGGLGGVELFGRSVAGGEQIPAALYAEESDGEFANEDEDERGPMKSGAGAFEEQGVRVGDLVGAGNDIAERRLGLIEVGNVLKRVEQRVKPDEKDEHAFEDPEHLCPLCEVFGRRSRVADVGR